MVPHVYMNVRLLTVYQNLVDCALEKEIFNPNEGFFPALSKCDKNNEITNKNMLR